MGIASEILTLLGTASFAAITGAALSHRRGVRADDAKEARELRDDFRAAGERIAATESKRADDCEARYESLASDVRQYHDRIETFASEQARMAVQLDDCERRHLAVERRMLRMERSSTPPMGVEKVVK